MLKLRKKSNTNSEYVDPKNAEMYTSTRNPYEIGICFILKYLGSHLIEEFKTGHGYSNGVSTDAIKAIKIMRNKGVRKSSKSSKVDFVIKSSGITVFDHLTHDTILESSIDRISFCTADGTYPRVFAYIARNSINETMECHAFSCTNSKMAFDVSLAVNQAFHVAKDELEYKSLQIDKFKNATSETNKISSENKLPTPVSTHDWVVFNE